MKALNQTSSRRAFVTGATGFIGRCLVQQLNDNGWTINVLSRRCPTPEESTNAKWYKYSGTFDSIYYALSASQPDVVFHLASQFLRTHASSQLDSLLDANLRFGTQLLEAMEKTDVRRIINTGTNWQHLDNVDYNPVNLYAATKQAFEAIIDYYCRACNFGAITLKLYDTYGPNDPRDKLIPYLETCLKSGLELNMSDGLQKIYLVHVDDVASAYIQACDSLVCSSHLKFGVCHGVPLTIREILNRLALTKNANPRVNWGSRPKTERLINHPISLPGVPGWNPTRSFPN